MTRLLIVLGLVMPGLAAASYGPDLTQAEALGADILRQAWLVPEIPDDVARACATDLADLVVRALHPAPDAPDGFACAAVAE